jgi:hypothetical protein
MVASIIFPALIPAGVSGYTIENAIWFDGSSDYLTRTFSSGGDTKTWTFSTWAKPGEDWANLTIFAQGDYNGEYTSLYFDSNAKLYLNERGSGAWNFYAKTDAVFRDPTAWVHFVVTYDVTPSTPSASSIKLFVNGAQVTAFDTISPYPSQNTDTTLNEASAFQIGRYPTNDPGYLYEGYLAETILVDGTALDADSFGEYDSNGVWGPIKPPTSLGTTGFHLDYKSADVGNDAAGSNNFTAVSSGTNNVVVDTPTDSSSAVVNIQSSWDSSASGSGTLSNSNLSVSLASYNEQAFGFPAMTSHRWNLRY